MKVKSGGQSLSGKRIGGNDDIRELVWGDCLSGLYYYCNILLQQYND